MTTRLRSTLLAIALAVALSIAAAAAIAATTADRSPFTQGHWWDPTRSGHGFEIFNAAGQVALVWYTYDEAGNPTWYYAQGAVTDLGAMPFDLLRTRWSNGSLAAATKVGTVRLTVRHSEAIELVYAIGSTGGTWNLQPFVASGVVSEVDHSGHWFDPAHNGWGFTLAEQGDVLGAVFYFYDPAGEPTWRAGFGRSAAQRKVDIYTTRGSCPSCPPRAITTEAAGSVTFDYKGEASLTIASAMTAPLASGLRIDGASATQLGRPASTRPADRQLASFGGDAALLAYMREGMKNVRTVTNGGSDFSAAPPGSATPYSPTNVQETDVDEGALVVTDGRFVDAFRYDDVGRRLAAVRIAEVEGNGAAARARGAFELAAGERSAADAAGLFRYSDRLVAITGSRPQAARGWALSATTGWQKGVTNLEILDAANPAAPVRRWTASFDGHMVANRRIGDRLFLVLRHVPSPPANLNFSEMPLDVFMPKVRAGGGEPVDAVPHNAFYAPPLGAIPATADMTIVHEVDLASMRVSSSLAVVGSVETVYVSTGAMYLATTRTPYRSTFGGQLVTTASGSVVTDIHRIALAGGVRVGQTGTLEGFLSQDADQAQFRLSEHEGRLRVVTSTSDGSWWGQATVNRLTILEPSSANPGVLKTVAYLPNAKRPEPIGEAQETLYATRFVGDRLYAVTYRLQLRVDPLYAVDLSVPTDPKILGELVVPGFSEYLHPLAGGYLLGFGRNITETGFDQGLKVSLFDVRDDVKLKEVAMVPFGQAGSSSALQRHHHAFSAVLAADGSGTFAIPASLTGFSGQPSWLGNWDRSGLMRFAVRKTGSSLTLEALPSLITASREASPWLTGFNDPAANDGRSVIFSAGTLYYGNGWFWHMDAAGNKTGPF